mgnify:CR=1 FL=1
MAGTTRTLAQAEQGVQAFFGRTPQNIVQPLHRSVEAFNWLGALFQCIEEVNNSGDRVKGRMPNPVATETVRQTLRQPPAGYR